MEIRVPVFNKRNRTMVIELRESSDLVIHRVWKELKIDISDFLSVIEEEEISRGVINFTVTVRYYFNHTETQHEKIYYLVNYDKEDCVIHLMAK